MDTSKPRQMVLADSQSHCSITTNFQAPESVSSRGMTDDVLQKATIASTVTSKKDMNSNGIGALAADHGKRFTSQIFDIYVGTERDRFTAHEVFLARSPRLKAMCTSQTIKKGNGKAATTLVFLHEHPKNFGYLLEYLYFTTISVSAPEPLAEAKQFAELFALANKFQLDEMQENVISLLENSELSSKLTPLQFFNLAEDLYSEDRDCGLHAYFAIAAPPLIRAVQKTDLPEIERMIADGGEYAQALFAAYREAFGPKVLQEPASSSSDTNNVIDVEIDTTTTDPNNPNNSTCAEDGDDKDHRHEAKRAKLSPSSAEHLASNPSARDDDLSTADRALVQLRAETKNWNRIHEEWEKVTGEKASIKALITRYAALFWHLMKHGYLKLLLSAESLVETRFRERKWDLVAQTMVDHHRAMAVDPTAVVVVDQEAMVADRDSTPIKFPAEALKMAFDRFRETPPGERGWFGAMVVQGE